MNNTIEVGSKWISDTGITVVITELIDKKSSILVFYTEELTGAKRSFGRAGFLTRFTKI